MNKNLLSCAIVGLTMIFLGCNSTHRGVDSILKEDSTSLNYIKYCAGCHGKNLESFKAKDWYTTAAASRMFNAIKYGIASEGMASFDSTFSDNEISKLVVYLKEKNAIVSKEIKKTIAQGLSYRTEEYDLLAVLVAKNLEIPWAMQMLPEGDILFTEQNGALKRLLPNGEIELVTGLPKVRDQGQGGLLDIKLHPNFANNQLVYFSFSKPLYQAGAELGTTAVSVGKLVGNELQEVKEIFEARPYVSASHHYAGRLQFDRDGYLFISVGDRGSENQHPQFLTNSCGKIHRINADGSIPKDNPFVNISTAVHSIFSYGHRNPQGLALRKDGSLWENEHGPRGGDEINKILAGKNYGWPLATFGINYNGTTITKDTSIAGMIDPIMNWTPSIAPSSLCFVNGANYGKWEGNLMSSSLKFDYVSRCVLQGDKIIKEEKILEGIGRIRNIVQLADGKIYVSVENPGRIYRIDVVEK